MKRPDRRAAALSLAALLAALPACEDAPAPQTPADTVAVVVDTVRPGTAPVHAGLRWDAQTSGAGMSLTLLDAAGEPLLRIACVRDPALMTVEVETFEPVGSEERLSFGVDDEPFVFVADPTAERPVGVRAEAPISDDLLERMTAAREVRAVYGAQTLGPHIPPDPETTGRFVAACRQIMRR
jgi:hypothetical protein